MFLTLSDRLEVPSDDFGGFSMVSVGLGPSLPRQRLLVKLRRSSTYPATRDGAH